MPILLKIVERIDGKPTEHDGRFVVYFNPDTPHPDGNYDGGKLITAEFPQHAQRFPGAIEALEYWKQPATCPCHATRPWDGKPNRPMTAYTVQVVGWDPVRVEEE